MRIIIYELMRIIILIDTQAEILRGTEQSGMLTTEQSCIQLVPLLFFRTALID